MFLIIFIISGCGWHLRNTTTALPQMKKVMFDPEKLDHFLSLAIRNQLHLNNIKVAEEQSLLQDIPVFRVLNSSISRNVVSIFQDGRIAEHQMVLSISAVILVPGKDIYPINTKVYRSFFDYPRTALEKDAEQHLFLNEMYNKAAEQLIHKLSGLQLTSKHAASIGHSI